MNNKDQLDLYNKLNKILPPFIRFKFPTQTHRTDDFIHEVFIKIVSKGKYDKAKDISKRQSYYTTICKNHIIDELKKDKTRVERNKKYSIENGLIDDTHYDVLYETDYSPKHQLMNILSKLTRVERYIINELYVKNKNRKQVRTYLGISKNKMNRYVSRLQSKLLLGVSSNKILLDYIKDKKIKLM